MSRRANKALRVLPDKVQKLRRYAAFHPFIHGCADLIRGQPIFAHSLDNALSSLLIGRNDLASSGFVDGPSHSLSGRGQRLSNARNRPRDQSASHAATHRTLTALTRIRATSPSQCAKSRTHPSALKRLDQQSAARANFAHRHKQTAKDAKRRIGLRALLAEPLALLLVSAHGSVIHLLGGVFRLLADKRPKAILDGRSSLGFAGVNLIRPTQRPALPD